MRRERIKNFDAPRDLDYEVPNIRDRMTSTPLISFLSLLLVGACLQSCNRSADVVPAAPAPPPEVRFSVVAPERLVIRSNQPGRLEPYRRAEVRARVPGIVLGRPYVEGQEVKQGTVLFQIDPAPYKAELESASAALEEAEAAHVLAMDQKERYSALVTSNAVSVRDMKEADAAEKQALARISVARSAEETARLRLGYATVVSPIDGRARRAEVTEGALVGEGSATLLTTVEQLDPIYVNFSQPLAEVMALRKALSEKSVEGIESEEAKVCIKLAGGETYSESGKVIFSDLAVDAGTDTVQLRALVPNPKRELFPGMFVRVELEVAIDPQAILIPRDSLVRTADGAFVMVIDSNNQIEAVPVEAKAMEGDRWHAVSGLRGGERIVLDNAAVMAPGTIVVPVPAESPKP